MISLPNMGLVKWNELSDSFSHAQLASNFELIDNHNHTFGKGVQIPFGGLAPLSVGIENLQDEVFSASKIVNNSISTEKLENESVTGAKIAKELKPLTWYSPSIIATEQSITTTSFKLMSENGASGTADEVKEVVLPTNGLIAVGYTAAWKSSAAAGKAAIFLGTEQVKITNTAANTGPELQNAATPETGKWFAVASDGGGLLCSGTGHEYSGNVTTGQILAAQSGVGIGGFCLLFASAGTYAVSVKFNSSSGSVTAKERKLWCAVLGY